MSLVAWVATIGGVVVFVSISIARELLKRKENYGFLSREFPAINTNRTLDPKADWDMATIKVDGGSYLSFSVCDGRTIGFFAGSGLPTHKLSVPVNSVADPVALDRDKWWRLATNNITTADIDVRILVRGESRQNALKGIQARNRAD